MAFHAEASSIWFYTVTLTTPDTEMLPGDNDPSVPNSIANLLITRANQIRSLYPNRQSYLRTAEAFHRMGEGMQRGGSTPWWESASNATEDEMIYECDARLGSPDVGDCKDVEWQQLTSPVSPASNTLSLTAGQVTFFHSRE